MYHQRLPVLVFEVWERLLLVDFVGGFLHLRLKSSERFLYADKVFS
ncbi:MAG: hypothetical protein OXI81_09145 [Paracoccaceae bacterium]|nr:hypothetical protein [Paracoccaceae bacterium]MDE2913700.1 hypothetical protein [Paracoccaceae bacterium]